MTLIKSEVDRSTVLNNRQSLYIGYTLYVLVDLVVLNLFVEFWKKIVIESFLISLLTACLLQLMLKVTLKVEHRVAAFFKTRSGTKAKVMRWLSAWTVLFGSKFVILEAVELVFGDKVSFGGIIPFIVVIVAIIFAEILMTNIYHHLADDK